MNDTCMLCAQDRHAFFDSGPSNVDVMGYFAQGGTWEPMG